MKHLTFFILLSSYACAFGQLTSSNLPIFRIQTNGQAIQDEVKITGRLEVVNNGPAGFRNFATDPANDYDGFIGIEIRGASSVYFDQKSYSVETRDSMGNDLDAALLGLPAESDWALRGPYNDKSLLRDALTYQLSNEMGRWAPQTRFCEVLLNGHYEGVYTLLETNKRGKERVDIAKLKTIDLQGEDLTGGYMFKVDRWEEGPGWIDETPSGSTLYLHYVYPSGEKIMPEQAAYLQGYVDSFENAILLPFNDTLSGWRHFADEASFIDHFIINELSRNVDSYRLSGFFHKNKNGKIKAGPIWDYNLAWRNADYCQAELVEGWTYSECGGGIPFWWTMLLKDTAYTANLRCRWKQLRSSTLSDAHIHHLIDSMATLLQEAQGRHFTRWDLLGKYVWPVPHPFAATYNEEIAMMEQWARRRLAWLDSNMPGRCGNEVPPSPPPTDQWILSPNPVSSHLRVQYNNLIFYGTTLEVLDVFGRLWQKTPVRSSDETFDWTSLAAGAYVVTIRNGRGERLLQQVVVKL